MRVSRRRLCKHVLCIVIWSFCSWVLIVLYILIGDTRKLEALYSIIHSPIHTNIFRNERTVLHIKLQAKAHIRSWLVGGGDDEGMDCNGCVDERHVASF